MPILMKLHFVEQHQDFFVLRKFQALCQKIRVEEIDPAAVCAGISSADFQSSTRIRA